MSDDQSIASVARSLAAALLDLYAMRDTERMEQRVATLQRELVAAYRAELIASVESFRV